MNTPFPTRVSTDVDFKGKKRPHSRELDFGNTRLPYDRMKIFDNNSVIF